MKQLLNTLYITTPEAYLSRDGETVLVEVDHETKLRVPIHTLSSIVCFGPVVCTPFLMHLCTEHDVAISFMSEHGKFLARVQGPVSGNVYLRKEQYRKSDDLTASAEVARSIVIAKLSNCRNVLMRAARERDDGPDTKSISHTADHIADLIRRLSTPSPLDQVRGFEGDGARAYFSVFDHLITAQKNDFYFHERSRRPPLDNINALLSFLYTLLVHDVSSAIETVGLDPAVGFLHRDRPGRPGLALDMIEELRPYLADRLALTLINRQQIKGKGFVKTESGAVWMGDDTRKEVLVSYQNRKREEISHPFLGEKIQIGMIPFAQSLLMARFIRGELDGYPPFFWK